MTSLSDLTVFRCLHDAGVALQASSQIGDGLAIAVWDRNEIAFTRYDNPNHHTLSLYLEHGEGFRKRLNDGWKCSNGAGDLCLMPARATSDWEVSGPIRMFHLYIAPHAFDRATCEMFDMDPARVSLREDAYFRHGPLEDVVRSAILPLQWSRPADRVAVGQAATGLMAYLLAHMTDRRPDLPRRGGLSMAAFRRVEALVDAHMDHPLSLDDLAGAAGLSSFHFARAFRQSRGETPHGFVTRRRIERAQTLLRRGWPPSRIAILCGFSSHSHLTARFRTHTGLTPTEYARHHGRTPIGFEDKGVALDPPKDIALWKPQTL
ncbi:helix-turn-helix transcriptional regulator [Gluconacetobacter azotocaptans]|uniref:helix-turn-helix transcriptional regulator n=1 Tax=Gluconacetobacter azotocaptans TaxID=142834 RepID=UPI001958EC0A|nr:AraC family transcriptional regulator [Gluconacetobacter azotocaptans]MBM9401203.1 helix-turn-helix transcriptional regulator [Gluconacetobacter azotocaptans]